MRPGGERRRGGGRPARTASPPHLPVAVGETAGGGEAALGLAVDGDRAFEVAAGLAAAGTPGAPRRYVGGDAGVGILPGDRAAGVERSPRRAADRHLVGLVEAGAELAAEPGAGEHADRGSGEPAVALDADLRAEEAA